MQNILANNDIIDHDSIILQCKIKLLICFLFRVRAKHKTPSVIFYIFSVRTVSCFELRVKLLLICSPGKILLRLVFV